MSAARVAFSPGCAYHLGRLRSRDEKAETGAPAGSLKDVSSQAATAGAAPLVSMSDFLVERAIAADGKAFRQLFERHAPAVRRFLGDLCRDDAAADEATQETFVRAHAQLGTLRDHSKLRPWLFRIARYVWLESRRRSRRTVSDDEILEREPDRAPDPEAILLGREAAAVVTDALSVLDDDRRAALLLRVDQGLGYEEIAETMDWPLSKVKNEIHRARKQLRARLSSYMGGTR
jgi:RNA polymerase sigma-70 factor, ECF subfamily